MHRARLINTLNWITLGLMAASLPTSKFTFSMFQFVLAGLMILDGISRDDCKKFHDNTKGAKKALLFLPFHFKLAIQALGRKIRELPEKKLLLVFLLFFLVHLIGTVYSENLTRALSVLKGKLPMILIPVFMLGIREVKHPWKDYILLVFVAATFVATMISTGIFLSGSYNDIRQISPFINHISLSLFVVFSVFIMLLHRFDHSIAEKTHPAFGWIIAGWLVFFLLFVLKSLTGIVILFAGMLTILWFPSLFRVKIKPLTGRLIALGVAGLILAYGLTAVWKFYDVARVDFNDLDANTSRGNTYWHDPSARILENGQYVYLYISDEELRDAWNSVSNFSYDGKDKRGQDLRYTLYRYMTAIGVRKDKDGFLKMNTQDIVNVENGISNPVFTKRFALYPRIYQTIWEYDVYCKTGSFAQKSFIQRITSLRIGVEIVKAHPFTGVGTGDVVDRYLAHYANIEYEEQPTRFVTGANQWLNFAAAFGIPGLILILFSFIYPATRRQAFQSPLFVMFILLTFVAMFGEDSLRYQTGLTFFAFFYGFFVFLNPRSAD